MAKNVLVGEKILVTVECVNKAGKVVQPKSDATFTFSVGDTVVGDLLNEVGATAEFEGLSAGTTTVVATYTEVGRDPLTATSEDIVVEEDNSVANIRVVLS